jgi:hypothetical protein
LLQIVEFTLICLRFHCLEFGDTQWLEKWADSMDGHWMEVGLEYVKMTGPLFLIAALWPSIALWLYASSGFIIKFARRFDQSLGWFNRRFDIEKKPLSSIGLVAGALVALIYWAAVIVSRVV